MLKIIDVGKFKCDRCKDGKKKSGVELQSYGCDIQAPVSVEGEDGSTRVLTPGHRYVWREQVHLCLNHLQEYIRGMIDDLPIGGLRLIHQQASMKPGFVNTTYEEMQRKGPL